ncbi:hypothetical protein HWV62_28070 [Athelia sp. TMB]|nr:hypothetical protein HWV62_28070 [Athelia sp. TMB]
MGLGLAAALAARPQVVVFAGARNPSAATELQALARSFPGKVHPIKLISSDQETNVAAVEEIKKVAGRLDVVIANAGQLFASFVRLQILKKVKYSAICDVFSTIQETTPDELRTHFDVNVVGPQVLFQATYPLLKASTPAPKFIVISSIAGSLALGPGMPVGNGAYAISKAAVNYLARKLHFENEGLICFPIHPGTVATDGMLSFVAKLDESIKGLVQLITTEESAAGLVKIIEESTREKDGGEFLVYDGTKAAW